MLQKAVRRRVRLSLGRLMRVCGHSMAPAINPGELVLVDSAAYEARKPRRGELVAVRPASIGGRAFIKRIAGLPLEQVNVDGKTWHLKEGEFFLLGDRSGHSLDSRIFGPVTHDELIGPIRLRLWPWRMLHSTKHDEPLNG